MSWHRGTILWMADERAIGEHVVPRITSAAAAAGKPAPRIVAGVPVALCRNDEVDGARARANKVLGHAEYSPNYQRLIEHGRRHRRRRHLRGGRRVGGRRAVAQLPRCGRHRPVGAGAAARSRPRRAARVLAANAGVPRRRSVPSSDQRATAPTVSYSQRAAPVALRVVHRPVGSPEQVRGVLVPPLRHRQSRRSPRA